MMKKILSAALLLTIVACSSNDPDFVANPDYNANRYGQFKTDTLYAVLDSVVVADTVNTNNAGSLTLANMAGFTSGFVVRYLTLPDDTLTLKEIKMNFITEGHFGSDPQEVLVDIYEVNEVWDATTIINEKAAWHDAPPGTYLKTVSMMVADSAESNIALDMDLLKKWQSADSLNTGLYFTLNPSVQNMVLQFNSLQSTQPPRLIYSYKDTSDTVTATNDASIFSYDEINGTVFSPQGRYVASGIPRHYLVRFDFTQLSTRAIYYNADLVIPYDDAFPYTNPNKPGAFTLRMFDDEAAENENPSSTYVITEKGTATKISNQSGFASQIVQSIVNENLEHKWFSVEYAVESDVFSVIRFFGQQSAQKPMLIVKYLEK